MNEIGEYQGLPYFGASRTFAGPSSMVFLFDPRHLVVPLYAFWKGCSFESQLTKHQKNADPLEATTFLLAPVLHVWATVPPGQWLPLAAL